MPLQGKSKAPTGSAAPKSTRGGRRTGAARPSEDVARLRAEIAAEANELIASRIDQLVRNMFVLADGVIVESTRNAKVQAYSTPPDRAANIYLLDRVLGKVKDGDEAPPMVVVTSEVAEAAIAAALKASGVETAD
jgi:hypothetical protein